jgi:hypothetical protein
MRRGPAAGLAALIACTVPGPPAAAASVQVYCLDRRVAVRAEPPAEVLAAHPTSCALSEAMPADAAERLARAQLGGLGADCYCSQNRS